MSETLKNDIWRILERRRYKKRPVRLELAAWYECPCCHMRCVMVLVYFGPRRHKHAIYKIDAKRLSRLA